MQIPTPGPRSGLTLLLLALTACGGGGSTPIVVGGNPGDPGGSSDPAYSATDWAGDWVGLLQPANPAKDPFPVYLRFDAEGQAFEVRDGLGHTFIDEHSLLETAVTGSTGKSWHSFTRLRDAIGHDVLSTVGRINASRTASTGTYTLSEYGQFLSTGTYEFVMSIGEGHFTLDDLSGTWAGRGFQAVGGAQLDMTLDIATDGTVLGGEFDGDDFIVAGINASALFFSNSAIGLLENVVLHLSSGDTLTLDYALLDDTGTFFAGMGNHSSLGAGIVHLRR